MDDSVPSGPRFDVAVVGTVNLDHTVRVSHLPAPGEGVMGDAVVTGPGGKGANQAVAAARLGARTALIGCVGDDPSGVALCAFLDAEPGVDVVGLGRVAGISGAAFVTVDASGANTVVSVRGANARLDEAHVHRHGRAIADASVLLVQLGVAADAVQAALEIARSVGTIAVLDPSPPDAVTDELLRMVDVCTPNETEAQRLTGIAVTDLDGARRAAEALLARGCAAVVVTLGARGAYMASAGSGDDLVVPPFPVDAVDPTGAGDAFCGALAAGLGRRVPFADALVDAAAAGALATCRPGAASSLPTRAEVDELRTRA